MIESHIGINIVDVDHLASFYDIGMQAFERLDLPLVIIRVFGP